MGFTVTTDLIEVERAIQLAIAPAFLLTACMTGLNVLSNRLNRLIDREAALHPGADDPLRALLVRRAVLIQRAVFCIGLAAIQISLLVACGFIGVVFGLPLVLLVGILVVGAMGAIVVAMLSFVTEIALARRHMPDR
jgi:hypothetical protein